MHKAVFLDRDGTIIEDVGYLNNPENIKFIPGSISAIKKLNEAGYKIVIITNQAGVARGLIREDILQTIDKTINKHILSNGAHIDAIYYCPHHPEHGVYPYKQDCECRKPNPGMLKKAASDLELDMKNSFVIGDKWSDVEVGKNMELKTALVLTGKGKNQKEKLTAKPDFIAKNLAEAVDWVLKWKN